MPAEPKSAAAHRPAAILARRDAAIGKGIGETIGAARPGTGPCSIARFAIIDPVLIGKTKVQTRFRAG
jgi:hypothetical protein